MKQGQRNLRTMVDLIGFSLGAVGWVLLTGACNKGSEGQGSAAKGSDGRAQSPGSARTRLAAPSSSAREAAPASPGSFDNCLVGRWTTTQVVLRRDQITASGGAGIVLEIKPTGETTIDFGPMSVITANAPPTVFDYTYAGKSTATLSTPSPGSYEADSIDYAKVTVSAKVSVPGAGAVELFKSTPLTQLEALGKAGAKVDDGLPLPETAGPGQQAIDPAPILSGTSYSCTANKLELKGPPGSAAWQLERAR